MATDRPNIQELITRIQECMGAIFAHWCFLFLVAFNHLNVLVLLFLLYHPNLCPPFCYLNRVFSTLHDCSAIFFLWVLFAMAAKFTPPKKEFGRIDFFPQGPPCPLSRSITPSNLYKRQTEAQNRRVSYCGGIKCALNVLPNGSSSEKGVYPPPLAVVSYAEGGG